jgi:uncharacterized protein (TIRG00374 family)
MSAPSQRRSFPLHTLLIALLTVLLMALFLRGMDWREAWQKTREANLAWLAAAILVTLQTYVIRSWRWVVLLRPIGRASFRTSFRTTVIGFAASAILPARIGEVLRPYLLARRERLNAASCFATIIVERLLDLVMVVLLFAIALATASIDVGSQVRVAGGIAAVASVLGLVILCVLAGHPERLGVWTERLARRLPGRARQALGQFVRMFAEGLSVLRSPGHLAFALFWTLPLWLSIALGILFTFWSFGISMSLAGSFIVVGYLTVGVAAPTPGGAGGFEVMCKLALTQFFAVSASAAGAAAIVLHLVSFVPVTLLGLLFLWQDGLTLGRLRGMRNEAEAAEQEEVAPS